MTDHGPNRNCNTVEESLGAELQRMWTGEIKPHFDAEAEFLQKYGQAGGYDRAYVGRVMSDHRLLEELVWGQDDENVARFAKVLAAHIHFKQAFFEERIRSIVELVALPPEVSAAETHS